MVVKSKLRVGVVGYGQVAENAHVPALSRLNDRFSIAAVADPSPERREAASSDLGLEPTAVFSVTDALFESDLIDVALLAVPPSRRPEIASQALGAGVHVVAEKPLASTEHRARALVQEARSSTARLFMVHNYLFFPEIEAARTLATSGAIGAVRHVSVNMLGVVADEGDDWRTTASVSGGGVLMDMMHAVYLAQTLSGEEVETCTALAHYRDGTDIEDQALVLGRGVTTSMSMFVGWGHGSGGIEIVGDRGRVSIHYEGQGTPPFAPAESVEHVDAQGVVSPVPFTAESPRESFVSLWDDLYTAIIAGVAARSEGSSGLQSLRVVLAAYRSSNEGQHVTVTTREDVDALTQQV